MLTLLSPHQPLPAELPKGFALLMDKPLAWTSFDVVNKVRWHLGKRLGVKRPKVGHAGTLDPLATGLLVICCGDYTKRIDDIQGLPKEYTGTITFGATTPSYDREKAVNATFPTAHLTDELLLAALPEFLGNIEQYPPIFSAMKVDGERLYATARAGRSADIAARRVHIENFEIGPLRPVLPGEPAPVVAGARGATIMLHPDYADGLQADFRVVCSKGTYIRSLAHDLGVAVGSGAYLSGLRRLGIGEYKVENAWQVEQWVEKLRSKSQ